MGIEHEIRVRPLNSTGGDGAIDVSLLGESDLSTSGELGQSFVRNDVSVVPQVLVDLTHVSFLDSAAVGVLVAACNRARSAGGTLSVRCSKGPALQVLEVSGLLDLFEVQGAT